MNTSNYSMSFTTGGLFLHESPVCSELYLSLGDWNLVQARINQDNLLQTRTVSSATRTYREIRNRLSQLTDAELTLVANGNGDEKCQALWLAACRQYSFVAEFAIEVLHERFISLNHQLHQEDFDAFFNKKAEWHQELDAIRATTRNKLRQVLFRMLKESGITTPDKRIHEVVLSPRIKELILLSDPKELLFFPTLEANAKGMRS